MSNSKKWIIGLIAFVFVFGTAFASAQPAQAFSVDNDGKVTQEEVIDDDLLLSGSTVIVDGTVNGILIASGSDIIINGTINGDALCTGSTVTISEGATITGNLFTAGQTILIAGEIQGSLFGGSSSMTLKPTASVARNVFYGGYSLETMTGSTIGKDLAVGAYQAILAGSISRDAQAAVAALKLDGKVGRNLQAEVDKPGSQDPSPMMFMPQSGMPATINPGLTIGEDASIGGDIIYTSPAEQSSAIESKPAGTVIYRTPVPEETKKYEKASVERSDPFAFFKKGIGKGLADMARNFMSLYILGALALWLIPGFVKSLSELVRTKALASAGYGFVTLVLTWVGAGLAFIVIIAAAILLGTVTFGGLGVVTFFSGMSVLGLFLTGFGLMVSFGSKLVVAYFVGNWIIMKMSKKTEVNPFLSMLVGVIVYVLLRQVFVLGWLVAVAVTFLGMGALWLYVRSLRSARTAQ